MKFVAGPNSPLGKIASLEEDFEQAEADLKDIQMLKIISENHYQELNQNRQHAKKADYLPAISQRRFLY